MTRRNVVAILKLAAIVAVIFFGFWLGRMAETHAAVQDIVQRYHYFGVFTVAIISGINLLVPIPAVAFMPLFSAAGLSVWPVIFTITFGVTIGDYISYLIGRVGREFAYSPRFRRFVSFGEHLEKKHVWGPLFFLFLFAAFVPFPNEVIVAPLAFIGYRWLTILPVVFFGNLVFGVLGSIGLLGVFKGF